ncbi:MAG: hypothetical protein JWM98_1123 [Thermoleophilia bacterium]|nr:hypothetical protein [Thermoleophilia bacterium]
MTASTTTSVAAGPLLACRQVVARVAFSRPEGWLYIAFCPRLVNLGSEVAHAVTIELQPRTGAWLEAEGCRVWPGEFEAVAPSQQVGDATLIALERDLADGLHAQHVAAGDLPRASWAVGIPLDLLATRPPGWLPIFESARTTVDLDRPGVWECGVPSDEVFGVAHYALGDGGDDPRSHYVALPFDRIYVPSGWTPPAALVDTDGN